MEINGNKWDSHDFMRSNQLTQIFVIALTIKVNYLKKHMISKYLIQP